MKTIRLATTSLLLLWVSQTPSYSASAYSHTKTGIILPPDIEGLRLDKKTVHDNKRLGESIVYTGKYAAATIHIYDGGRNGLENEPEQVLLSEELADALGDVDQVQEMGISENVKYGTSGKRSGKEGKFTFISMPVAYDLVRDPRTGKSIPRQSMESLVGIGLYEGYFIKLRYSLVPGGDRTQLKKQRDEFVAALVSLVLEVDIRPLIRNSLRTYFNDPFSEEGRSAMGAIVVYAQESCLVTITIRRRVTPWYRIDDYPYGSELLGAYVAGQVNSQLSSGVYESDEKAGMAQVLKVYKELIRKDKRATVEALDKYLTKGGMTEGEAEQAPRRVH